MEEREQESIAFSGIKEQLQDAREKIQHMLLVYERTIAERDEVSKQARMTAMHLSQQRLAMAHAQRQLDRARRENLRLRADIKDLSSGRTPQVSSSGLPWVPTSAQNLLF
jgi:archaellum component FlaC